MNDTDRLIRSLYAHVSIEDWEHFRPRALDEVARAFGASAAAWVTHSGSAWGELTAWPANVTVAPQKLMTLPFRGARDLPLPPDMALNGLRQGVALAYPHQDGGLSSVVVLWFGAKDKQPAASAIEALHRVAEHMSEASALSLSLYIQRDAWLSSLGRPNRGTSALVDSSGTIYAASRRFRELIRDSFGNGDATALPFRLPEEAFTDHGLFGEGNLRFRMSRIGDLYLVNARKPLPLDGLSPREQQIARALGNGKTFKTVARQCGIAVSTVANHASRIYRKLGIYRREDLVELIRAPRETMRH
ncbi:MAG: helix-turn-helix transcriptional regulator [Gammaproteobacteria bacterium]|nr:helix-turn-helix transcriptional regulator [Gammaproteobacteria bacterium]